MFSLEKIFRENNKALHHFLFYPSVSCPKRLCKLRGLQVTCVTAEFMITVVSKVY